MIERDSATLIQCSLIIC